LAGKCLDPFPVKVKRQIPYVHAFDFDFKPASRDVKIEFLSAKQRQKARENPTSRKRAKWGSVCDELRTATPTS
jgi:hypothetical protein